MGQTVNQFIFFTSNPNHFIFFTVNQNHLFFFTENQNHFFFSKKDKPSPRISNGRPLSTFPDCKYAYFVYNFYNLPLPVCMHISCMLPDLVPLLTINMHVSCTGCLYACFMYVRGRPFANQGGWFLY